MGAFNYRFDFAEHSCSLPVIKMEMNWRLFPLICALVAVMAPRIVADSTTARARTKVVCVGANITAGFDAHGRPTKCYVERMQSLLGAAYEVCNLRAAGSAMLESGDRSCCNNLEYREALAMNPRIVVIHLAGPTPKVGASRPKEECVAGASALIESLRALPSHPRVLLCLPVPSFGLRSPPGNEDAVAGVLTTIIRQVAFQSRSEVVDLHTPFVGKEGWFVDGDHMKSQVAATIARIVAGVIAAPIDTGFDLEKNLEQLGIQTAVTSFYGYRQLDFRMENGRHCTVVRPYVTASQKPIVWRGEFFGHEPQTDLALLERGYHVVYIDTRDMFGAPVAMEFWETYHTLLSRAGLTGKITLVGLSRGALYCYNWAARHPDTVAAIYGDAPVCDFKSWPGCKGRSKAGNAAWPELIKIYGFKDEAEALRYPGNPVDNLLPLAKAQIPIIHVIGEADTAVPVEENSDLVEKRYKQLGGTIMVIRKPGAEHHPHSLPNPEPIVDFILSHSD